VAAIVFTLNSGTVVLNNSGTISATVAGHNVFGAGMETYPNLTINSGSIFLQNSGIVGINSVGTTIGNR
jgi:hypothetical protein